MLDVSLFILSKSSLIQLLVSLVGNVCFCAYSFLLVEISIQQNSLCVKREGGNMRERRKREYALKLVLRFILPVVKFLPMNDIKYLYKIGHHLLGIIRRVKVSCFLYSEQFALVNSEILGDLPIPIQSCWIWVWRMLNEEDRLIYN